MRTFILKATQAPTSANLINLNNLKDSGRIDLVTRCISNALFISNHFRPDTIIHVVMEGKPTSTRILSFDGSLLKQFEYDERSIAIKIKKALEKGKNLTKDQFTDVEDGIKIGRMTFTDFVHQLDGNIYYLDKRGDDIRKTKFRTRDNNTFIFGDHKGFDKYTIRLLKRIKAKKIRLSQHMIYSSHCIVIVHNELDRQ